MGAIGGVALVRQELDLVAAGGSSVAEELAHNRGGYAFAAMTDGNHDCLDKRGQGAAVGQVRHRHHRRSPDYLTVDLSEIDGEIVGPHHSHPGLPFEIRNRAGTVIARVTLGVDPQDR